MLTICTCVIWVGTGTSQADSKNNSTEKRIAQLPSFVPMEKYADAPDLGAIKTAIENCIKNYSIGKEKENWAFWACIVKAFGKSYWDRNYKMIICMVYRYTAKTKGTDVAEICKNCYPDPCTNTKCNKVTRKDDCCDIEKIKCTTDAIMGDPNHLIVAASVCDREWKRCYQQNESQ